MIAYLSNNSFLIAPNQRKVIAFRSKSHSPVVLDNKLFTSQTRIHKNKVRKIQENAYTNQGWSLDYLYRIYFQPSQLDFGIVSERTDKEFIVWNTYFDFISLDSINASVDHGVSFPSISFPISFAPFSKKTFVIRAAQSGSTDISVNFNFSFNVGMAVFKAIGQRGFTFIHPIQWAESPKLKKTWKTLIQESLLTNENRINLYPKSRYAFTYEILTLSALQTQKLQFLLSKIGVASIVMPLWMDAVYTTQALTPGLTEINVTSTLGTRFTSGTLIVVNPDGETYEIRKMDLLSEELITLGEPIRNMFPVGSTVYPVLFGRFKSLPQFEWVTDENAKLKVEFLEAIS